MIKSPKESSLYRWSGKDCQILTYFKVYLYLRLLFAFQVSCLDSPATKLTKLYYTYCHAFDCLAHTECQIMTTFDIHCVEHQIKEVLVFDSRTLNTFNLKLKRMKATRRSLVMINHRPSKNGLKKSETALKRENESESNPISYNDMSTDLSENAFNIFKVILRIRY